MLRLNKEMISTLPNGIRVVNITSNSFSFRMPSQPITELVTIHGYDIGLEIETEFIPVKLIKDTVIQNVQFVCDLQINTILSTFSKENDCMLLGTENQAIAYPETIYLPTPYEGMANKDAWFNIYNPYRFITFYTDGSGLIKLTKLKGE